MGYKTWAYNIKTLLFEANLQNIWDGECIIKESEIIKLYKVKLYKKYVQDWERAVNNLQANPMLYMYRSYATNYNMAYHLCIPNYKIRNAITKFRVSSHNLIIETGRHTKPKTPRENRICKLCNNNEVGD